MYGTPVSAVKLLSIYNYFVLKSWRSLSKQDFSFTLFINIPQKFPLTCELFTTAHSTAQLLQTVIKNRPAF